MTNGPCPPISKKYTYMKVKAFQIHWHNKQPIYSCDFHPKNCNKLATCGGDNNVRVRRKYFVLSFSVLLIEIHVIDLECCSWRQ